MYTFQDLVGFKTYPSELKSLSLKYLILTGITSSIYLSYAWISLYYLKFLTYTQFTITVSFGLIIGIILDYPLGIVTDRVGQKVSYIFALVFLGFYYFGLMFSRNLFHFLIMESFVGIFTALTSGTLSAWFMNQWELLSNFDKRNNFGAAMSNIGFLVTFLNAALMLIGGMILEDFGKGNINIIFLFSSMICFSGISFAFMWMKTTNSNFDSKKRKKLNFHDFNILKGVSRRLILIFTAFSLISFTGLAYSSLIISPFLRFQLMNSLFYISFLRSIGVFFSAISYRLSSRLATFNLIVKKKWNFLLYSYLITNSLFWFFYAILPNINPLHANILFFLLHISRIVISGLTISIYWQLYYKITSSNFRSSQQSLHNTIQMIISSIGFYIMGTAIELVDFGLGFIILSIIGFFAFLILRSSTSQLA